MDSHPGKLMQPAPDGPSLEALEAHLLRRLSSRIRHLRICRREGGLILAGKVRTFYEKQLAQHALMEITAEMILRNEIVVDHNH